MKVNRRHLLVGGATLLLRPRNAHASGASQVDSILALLPDRKAAAKLGALWLQQAHAPPAEITVRLARRLDWSAGVDVIELRRNLAAAIGDDFRSGAMVKVEGWRIARTQIDLCALAYYATTGGL